MPAMTGLKMLLPLLLLAGPACAAGKGEVSIAYLGLQRTPPAPAVAIDPAPTDEGVQGARLALADDQTTGRFLGQTYALHETVVAEPAGVIDAATKLLARGERVLVLDLPPPLLLQVADLPGAADAVLLDATSEDDALRGRDCRKQMLHLLPSRAMLADALMQYLSVKQWRDVLLVQGKAPEDALYAEALRQSAKKFRLRIVDDKPWTMNPGAQRTDTGHVSVGAEAARFTQGLSYDVLVVADTRDDFGDDLAYRTSAPRPIAGTQGLTPTSWAPPFEEWGATQLQVRFKKLVGRVMTPRDFGAWMAVRAVGEAAARGTGIDAASIGAYLHGPTFELAAFKGKRLTFRSWNGQLRQPVLLADSRSLVSVSPQAGYLHQYSELDTLGQDQPETACKF